MSNDDFNKLLKQLRKVDWNVKILKRYSNGSGVATYLARYLKGGPIGNSRLLSLDNKQVVFRYRLGSHEGGDGKEQGVATLNVDTFIARLLEHVPPRRFQTVRGYGLYSGNQHSRIDAARSALEMPQAQVDEQQADRSWQEICEASGFVDRCRCPECGKILVSHSEFKRGRDPPKLPMAIGALLSQSTEAA